jgi:large subunit ribosomal protein L25
VHTTGTSKGVMKGGKLAYKQKRLNVKAVPACMPSEILLDITNLDVNQRIRVQDIACENYAILNPKSAEVVNVLSTRASATSDEGEGEAAAE